MAYATLTEFTRFGLPTPALSGVSDDDKTAALSAASSVADSYLATRYSTPLSSWGDDLRRAVCHIASWDLLVRRGFNPDDAANQAVRMRHKDAIAWLENVSANRATVTGGNTSPGASSVARVHSYNSPKNW